MTQGAGEEAQQEHNRRQDKVTGRTGQKPAAFLEPAAVGTMEEVDKKA